MIVFAQKLIGYTIYLIIILLGMYRPKSTAVTWVMSIYMWFVIAFNTSSADYIAYEEMYLCAFEPRYGDHEYGYMTLCRLCLSLGIPYILFRCVVAAFIVALTIAAVKQFSHRSNLVLSMYIIFPFLGCASGLRQACANAIVLYGFRYIINDKKGNTIKYIICLMFAALFHYSTLFFVILLYAKHCKTKSVCLFVQCFVASLVAFIVAKTGIIYEIISSFTSREKTVRWLTIQVNFSGLYLVSLILFILLLFVLYQARIIIYSRENTVVYPTSKFDYQQTEIVSKSIILTLLAFVGAMLNSVVYLRLTLTLIPIAYAVCSEAFVGRLSDGINRTMNHMLFKYGMIVFVVVCALFVFGFWIGGNMLSVPIGNPLFGG